MVRQFASALIGGCMAWSAAVAQGEISPSAREPEITASGRGEVRLTPAYATLVVNVTTRANTAGEAASQNAQRVDATVKALRGAGLAEKDVATLGYSLQQNYDYSSPGRQPEPAGFSAYTTIRAEVRRLENLGRVIDAATAGGATGVSGIQYFASNTEEARRSAMAQAVREARVDADLMARAAGGSLGRLIALNSGATSQPFPRDYSMIAAGNIQLRGASAPTNIAPSELNVTAVVFGRWEFIPGASR